MQSFVKPVNILLALALMAGLNTVTGASVSRRQTPTANLVDSCQVTEQIFHDDDLILGNNFIVHVTNLDPDLPSKICDNVRDQINTNTGSLGIRVDGTPNCQISDGMMTVDATVASINGAAVQLAFLDSSMALAFGDHFLSFERWRCNIEGAPP